MYFQEWKSHWFIKITRGDEESALGSLSPIGLIPNNVYYYPHGNHLNSFDPRNIKAHWVHPLKNFTVCNEMISWESSQGTLMPIGFIPRNFPYWPQVDHLNIFGPRGIKEHWVHTLHCFTGQKEILSIESAQGLLRPIGFICHNLFYATTRWLHINWKSIDLSSSDIATYFEIYYYQVVLVS